MSDVHCRRCLEPWDTYYINHDFPKWVRDLFRAGAGCESCCGEKPDNIDPNEATEQHLKDLIDNNADDNPYAYAAVNKLGSDFDPPKWIRPEDPKLFLCQSCDSVVRLNVDCIKDTEEGFLYWEGKNVPYIGGYDWNDCLDDALESFRIKRPEGTVPVLPSKWCISGRFYCPGCVSRCAHCNELTFEDDTRLPDGKYRNGEAVCEPCYEEIPRCSECYTQWDNDEEAIKCCKEPNEDD